MPRLTLTRFPGLLFATIAALAVPAPRLQAADVLPRVTHDDDDWRRSLELVAKGQFESAKEAAAKLSPGNKLVDQLRGWLADYESKQAERRRLDLADMERYVGYAKARIERKEYAAALDRALQAHDVAPDQAAFRKEEWLLRLVNDALSHADEVRGKNDWRAAYDIYWRLAALFENEPRYEKLEREAVTHLRLDAMFEDKDTWMERLEQIRWEDAETALECIELYYYHLEPDHFKRITESGLEQVLLLAESSAARRVLPGLQDPDRRGEFQSRVKTKLDQIRAAPAADRSDAVQYFRRVLEINEQTVDLPRELLVSELMRGAFEPMDDFTTIIWPEETEEFEKHTRGDFIGVGISIVKNRDSDEIEVVTPLEDTPACRAGVQSGDIIAAVDGKPLKGFSLNKVVDMIMGQKGSAVTLTIRRGEKEIEFPLVRDKIKIQSIKGLARKPEIPEQWNHWLDPENKVAYIRLTNFQNNTSEDLTNALSELEARGMRGLVLDLRGNPGGLLDAAWKVSSTFLKKGDRVVSTKGRIRSEDQQFDTPGDGAFSNTPLIVLTDNNSASASEIVAGAVRDNKRGLVLGERTFGKFSVQNLISLGRSNAKLKITTADYYLPSGVSLHRKPGSTNWGVEPNVPVRMVRKERFNVYSGWRTADRVGPVAGSTDVDDLDDLSDPRTLLKDVEGPTRKQRDFDPESGSPYAFDPNRLPSLYQPDENNRPKTDPQIDTALLVMRARLLGANYPTLAHAERETPNDEAKP